MQMNDKVLTALEVLKDCAENEFELHRINVLIRDLTDPPVAEQVDETHQRFNGIVYYYSETKGRYVSNAVGIHRAVWIYYHGDIPTDNIYEIHHKNLMPTDNHISNLQLLTKDEHHKLHSLKRLKSPRERICSICGKTFIRKQQNSKYCSADCANKAKFVYSHADKICPTCGKTFTPSRTNPKQIYCSISCAKRKPPVEKTCPICNKAFISPNHKNQIYCSIPCAQAAAKLTKKPPVEKVCPICGKVFTLKKPSSKKKYCSPDCAYKAARLLPKVEKVCPICGKKFLSRNHWKHDYCSKQCCRKAFYEENNR